MFGHSYLLSCNTQTQLCPLMSPSEHETSSETAMNCNKQELNSKCLHYCSPVKCKPQILLSLLPIPPSNVANLMESSFRYKTKTINPFTKLKNMFKINEETENFTGSLGANHSFILIHHFCHPEVEFIPLNFPNWHPFKSVSDSSLIFTQVLLQ